MSPIEELSRAADKILSRTDFEIAQIERWLSEETEEDLRSGHLAELERLREERQIVAVIRKEADTPISGGKHAKSKKKPLNPFEQHGAI